MSSSSERCVRPAPRLGERGTLGGVARGTSLLLFLLVIVLAGCEHSDVCTDAEAQRLGDACGVAHVFSTFPDEDTTTRAILGHLHAGAEPVGGARVNLAGALPAETPTLVTDPAGYYAFPTAPLVYDLTVLTGDPRAAGSDVLRWHCDRSGGGLTFADEFELAQCLSFLAAAPHEAASLAKAGREYVLANYRWDVVLDAMESDVKDLMCASS